MATLDTDSPTPEHPTPATVTEALARVMTELPGIGKDAESPQGYKYRGIESITRHAQELFGRYRVVWVPRVEHRETVSLQVGGKPWTEEQLTIVYRVYGPGGADDFIDVGPLIGLGRDNSDKGVNKAMTQAFKYALLQTLCIGDGKDDPDSHAPAERDADSPTSDPWIDAGWMDRQHHDEKRAELMAVLHDTLTVDAHREAFKEWRQKEGINLSQVLTAEQMSAARLGAERIAQGERPDAPAESVGGGSTESAAVDAATVGEAPPPTTTDASEPEGEGEACPACLGSPAKTLDALCWACNGKGFVSDTHAAIVRAQLARGPRECPRCGSTRAKLALVSGEWRCEAASDCTKRAAQRDEQETKN